MRESSDESEFDPTEREGDEADPDTSLIMDYLANKLAPDDAERLEERAKRDKAFRYKLCDIVLLKGIVMMALEKNPRRPALGECRRTQAMILAYLKGTTSAKETAQFSRHLDDCFECELAFDRFQAGPSEDPSRESTHRRFWRKWVTSPRTLLVVALLALTIAAVTFAWLRF